MADGKPDHGDGVNALLLLAAAAVSLFVLFGAPFVPAKGWTAVVLLVAVAGVSAPFHWALLHEAIHGHLFRSEMWNGRGGRLLAVLLGYSFDAVRFGHLAHHRHNRHSLDRPEILAPGKSWRGAAVPYYASLLLGQASGSLVAGLIFLMPAQVTMALYRKATAAPDLTALQTAGLRYFGDRARQWRIRLDVVLAGALFIAAFMAWGKGWPVLLACILARWIALSILDNAPHYGTPLDSNLYAPDMRAPSWLRGVLLNQNLHGLHHALPNLGWRELPAHFGRTGGAYAVTWATAVLRQFRGPIAL